PRRGRSATRRPCGLSGCLHGLWPGRRAEGAWWGGSPAPPSALPRLVDPVERVCDDSADLFAVQVEVGVNNHRLTGTKSGLEEQPAVLEAHAGFLSCSLSATARSCFT